MVCRVVMVVHWDDSFEQYFRMNMEIIDYKDKNQTNYAINK